MELKHDCIRDVLIYLEKELDWRGLLNDSKIDLPKYSKEDIKYTLLKLTEAGYITIERPDMAGNITIRSITFNGHQFLDNIRDNKVWSTTKGILSKFTSTSIGIVENVSAQVITNLIIASLK